MFDMSDLASARKKVQKKRVESSGDAYQDAVNLLEAFESNPEIDKELLEQAADKLIQSLQFNPDHVGSHICLAYIFYTLDEDELAMKHLNKAESIDDLPQDIINFKLEVERNLPWNRKKQESEDSLF